MLKTLYWVFPLVSAVVWLVTLMALLITWARDGSPHYASMSDTQTVAYISDIGAQRLKPLFVTGSVITTLALDFAFVSERYLRHKGRLSKNVKSSEKWLVGLSILFAAVGTAGLILLSIFDTLRHPHLHRLFLLFFMAGYVLSAIFICWEYQRLGMNFRQHRILRASFWVKLAFILIEIVLAIAFGSLMYTKHANPAAVLEWVIAFIFTFYVLSFYIDLRPAVRRGQMYDDGGEKSEVERAVQDSGAEQTGYYTNGRPADDSQEGLTGPQMGARDRVGL